MKVAVIGSAGQLGTDLVEALRRADHKVVPLTHAQVEGTDAASVASALQAHRPQVVINCAAFHRVDDCESRPEEAFRVNALGALHVARACAEQDTACVFISSDYVFSGAKRVPYTEDDAPSPLGVYGVSKVAGEWLVRNARPTHFVGRSSGV